MAADITRADAPAAASVWRDRLIQLAVVLVALGIVYLRTPVSFTNPQFWGEDIVFFDNVAHYGWSSMLTPLAGWLAVVQYLVAIVAGYFNPAWAPALYNYAAVLLTLLVVALVCSPRVMLPVRWAAALAVVVVPMAFEEIGTLTNIQWILPIGVVALMFMPASPSRAVLVAEAVFVALSALSGPFGLFLAPMFAWQAAFAPRGRERSRFILLTSIAGIGAVCQVITLALNPSILSSVVPTPYPWTTWVNLPFKQFMSTFGPAVAGLFVGQIGVALGLLLLVVATVLALRQPYRTQKSLMLFFALVVAVAGMYKFRTALGTQYSSNRYFYPGGVFAVWFICCLSDRRHLKTAIAVLVTLIELSLLPVVANTPRATADLEWPVWSRYFNSGLPLLIPSTPARFLLEYPAAPDGPLARFAPWLGHPIPHLSDTVRAGACSGAFDAVEDLNPFFIQSRDRSREGKKPPDAWMAQGWAWETAGNRPVQLVALTNSAGNVVGFGLPGFKNKSGAGGPPEQSGWTATFYAEPGQTLRAYGIVDDGQRLCELDNRRSFPLIVRPLATTQFAGGVEIVPGREIVQQFAPDQNLESISLRLVTWGKQPSPYVVQWRIVARDHGQETELGTGRIDATMVSDWQRVTLSFAAVPQGVPEQIAVIFRTDSDKSPSAPIGVALYRPRSDADVPPARIGTEVAPGGAVVGLDPAYVP